MLGDIVCIFFFYDKKQHNGIWKFTSLESVVRKVKHETNISNFKYLRYMAWRCRLGLRNSRRSKSKKRTLIQTVIKPAVRWNI